MYPRHVSICLVLLAAQAHGLPQGSRPKSATPTAFSRLVDTGPRGTVTLAIDPVGRAALEHKHAEEPALLLRDLPLPGGTTVDLELRPVSVMDPGARARVVHADGTTSLLSPKVRCFSGHVVGGGPAFLGLGEEGAEGYLQLGEELFFLTSDGQGPNRAILSHVSRLGTLDAGLCSFSGDLQAAEDGREQAAVTPSLRTAEVFIEADHQYSGIFPSNQACLDYTVLLMTAASEIYRRDIGTRLRIPDGYLRIWNVVPPWGVITGFNQLKNVYTWWQSTANPLRNLPRAAVHVLTAPVFGGTSRGVDGLCINNRAYEISSLNGRFPSSRPHTDRYNWDLFVVCHEFGHTFGSPHSQLYTPPILCEDGSGPDSGTIMSYCHTTYGMAKVGMRFHLREQQRIRSASADASCAKAQLLTPGDYDGNGSFDPGDLAALRGVMSQGFRSIAAEEVLDLDANGRIDDFDHDALAQLVYASPPAQVLPRNGTGINPSCLESLGNPVLGLTWRARIYAPGVGSSTLLVGYDEPLGGLPTSRGELLVKTTTFGGTKLFSSTAFSDGTSALHEIPLPLDPTLFGRVISFQALIVDGPLGNQYCNALDVVLSPYE